MTKATEIKLEDDRVDSKNSFRDRRRGMKLVPVAKPANRVRSFNIGVEENMFSPRGAMIGRSGSTWTDDERSDVDAKPSDYRQAPYTVRTIAVAGIFFAAGVLAFLIGRRRD